jgi:hypothetical protein
MGVEKMKSPSCAVERKGEREKKGVGEREKFIDNH